MRAVHLRGSSVDFQAHVSGWCSIFLVKMVKRIILSLLIICTQLKDSLASLSIKEVEVHFDGDKAIHAVNRFSPSVAVGMTLFSHQWIKYLGNPKLITLAKALGPAYLRMGGTKSDFSHFVDDSVTGGTPTADSRSCIGRMPNPDEFRQHLAYAEYLTIKERRLRHSGDFSQINISYTASEFDGFMNFVTCTGLKLIFGLNLLDRSGRTWNPANTLKLLEYAKSKSYRIDWELGNEPNSYPHKAGITLSAKQIAEDFLTFKNLLKSDKWWGESMIFGPDANNMFKRKSKRFLSTFLRRAGNVINSATFHQYYINSVNATVDNFTDYKILNNLNDLVDGVVGAVRKESSEVPIWNGETSSSYGGGADGLSNTYVAGFMWLDKLGLSAAKGIDHVFRQTLIIGHYSLISQNFDPNPDYWLTLLYKTLVGREVLNASVSSARNSTKFRKNGKLRVYAYCTNAGRTSYDKGAVTLSYLNLLSKKRAITINAGPGHLKPKVAMTYILTSAKGNLTSKDVYLNGERLEMIDIHTMPQLNPVKIDLGKAEIILPEKSFGFIVLPHVQAAACMTS